MCDKEIGLLMLFVCAGSLSILQIYEFIQMNYEGFRAYIDFYNVIDLLTLPVLILYGWVYMNNQFSLSEHDHSVSLSNT